MSISKSYINHPLGRYEARTLGHKIHMIFSTAFVNFMLRKHTSYCVGLERRKCVKCVICIMEPPGFSVNINLSSNFSFHNVHGNVETKREQKGVNCKYPVY